MNSSGFQRGFLLDKPTRAKGSKTQVQSQKPTNSLQLKSSRTIETEKIEPSSSQLLTESQRIVDSAKSEIKSTESKTTKVQQNPRPTRASKKNDSGWTKGFLTNKKGKKPSSTTVGQSHQKGKNNHARTSKAQSPVAVPSKGTDSGWSKGFLMHKNDNRKEKNKKDGAKGIVFENDQKSELGRVQKDQPMGNVRKAFRSSRSNILLSISDDADDVCTRDTSQIFGSTKNTHPVVPTRNRKPLISVLHDEGPNEIFSSANVHCEDSGVDGNTEAIMTNSTTKSLITPLISITREHEDREEEEASSILVQEVSTRRKLDHGRGDFNHSRDAIKEGEHFSPWPGGESKTENVIGENYDYQSTSNPTIGLTEVSSKNSKEKTSLENGHTGDDQKCILALQQELERLFSRPGNNSQPNEFSDQRDCDGLQEIVVQLKMPEHRRYAWIFLLQQRQQEQCRERYTRRSERGQNKCDFRIQSLFDAEFFNSYRKSSEAIPNMEVESPIESILRCVETELDRRIALQAVLAVREYFEYKYKADEQLNMASKLNAGVECIERVVSLFVSLTLLSLENKRTRLVQTAWETAILLFCFSMRESLGLRPPSLSLSYASLAKFRENLDLLLHRQLKWQESKTKLNAARISQLKKVRTKSKNIFEKLSTQENEMDPPSELLHELVADLEKLIQL